MAGLLSADVPIFGRLIHDRVLGWLSRGYSKSATE